MRKAVEKDLKKLKRILNQYNLKNKLNVNTIGRKFFHDYWYLIFLRIIYFKIIRVMLIIKLLVTIHEYLRIPDASFISSNE
jgi:hypothetical protein